MSDFAVRIQSSVIFTALWLVIATAQAQDNHQHVQTVEDPELKNLVSVSLSPDDQFLYAAGFDPGFLVCLRRDGETGMLEKAHSYPIAGLISVHASGDGRYVVASSFQTHEVMLFERDQTSGALEKIASISQGDESVIKFPVDVKFSNDSRFVYVSCSSTAKLAVLEIGEKELTLVQETAGEEESLKGCRILCLHPNGKMLYIASKDAGTIAVFDRDRDNGQVTWGDYIMDDSIYAALLEGVHGIDLSPDGRHLYATSGRFAGDSAVSVFKVKDNHELKMIQEFENGVELENFLGGNHIGVSPDGNWVYSTGARSGNLACFSRDDESGELNFVQYLKAGEKSEIGMTAGMCFSSDGRSLYVAGEGSGVIYSFHR